MLNFLIDYVHPFSLLLILIGGIGLGMILKPETHKETDKNENETE